MRSAVLFAAWATAMALLWSAPTMAQEPAPAAAPAVPAPAAIGGEATIRGRTIAYRATASELVLTNAAGEARATIFSAAYIAESAPGVAQRPVTFLFNGGPGAATIALREGLAPRVTRNVQAERGFAFVENPDSLIDMTDLVFIDAPGTGYSRMLAEGAERDYWGVGEDARANAGFIAAWLRENGREDAPLFLIGESYGGVRAALAAELLAARERPLSFEAIVFVSPSTTAGRRIPNEARDHLPVVHVFPSQAAVAWSHGRGVYARLPLERVVRRAQRFADGPLAAALAKGAALGERERLSLARRIAAFTGLPLELAQERDLDVSGDAFALGLLADRGERIGLSDGRAHALRTITDAREPPYNDPSTSPYVLTYDPNAAIETLFRDAFGYRPAAPYVRLSLAANQVWNHEVAGGARSVPEIIRTLMEKDRDLRVSLVMGYFDLNVPYARALNAFARADLPRGRFTHRTYAAGHAIFSDAAARAKATDDLRALYRRALMR